MSYIGPIPISTVIKQIRITSKNMTIKACLEGGGPGDAHKEGVLYGETGKSAYFLNIIRKTEILLDTGILYFEDRNMARFQSHRHCYCLDRSATLCRGPNDVLVPKSDQ